MGLKLRLKSLRRLRIVLRIMHIMSTSVGAGESGFLTLCRGDSPQNLPCSWPISRDNASSPWECPHELRL